MKMSLRWLPVLKLCRGKNLDVDQDVSSERLRAPTTRSTTQKLFSVATYAAQSREPSNRKRIKTEEESVNETEVPLYEGLPRHEVCSHASS